MAPTGKPQRLYLLQLGTTTIPGARGPLSMSSGCYLVQTSADEHILIDSGLPSDYTPPAGAPAAENQRDVLQHLATLGLAPGDIDLVI
ncbi:MAG TPA: hypothetical protein VFU72_16460 [Nitrolancea sp.]|nr:hypothetical protein [Nitrolancea sp.]